MSNRDLDELLKKYSDKLPFEDNDDEKFEDVLEKVSERFHFVRSETIVGNGKPKMTHIPFYSHENDVFKEYEDNASLFIDDCDEEALSIGIISKLQHDNINKNSSRYNVSDLKLSEDGKSIDHTNKYKFISDMKCWLDYIVSTAHFHVIPREIIHLKITYAENGDKKAVIDAGIFDDTIVDDLRREFSKLIGPKIISREFSKKEVDMIDDIRKSVLDFLNLISAYYHNLINKAILDMFLPVRHGNSTFFDKEIVQKYSDIQMVTVGYKSLNSTKFAKLIDSAQKKQFSFSKLVAKRISNKADTNYPTTYECKKLFKKFPVEIKCILDEFVENFVKVMENINSKLDGENDIKFTPSLEEDNLSLMDQSTIPEIEPIKGRNLYRTNSSWE